MCDSDIAKTLIWISKVAWQWMRLCFLRSLAGTSAVNQQFARSLVRRSTNRFRNKLVTFVLVRRAFQKPPTVTAVLITKAIPATLDCSFHQLSTCPPRQEMGLMSAVVNDVQRRHSREWRQRSHGDCVLIAGPSGERQIIECQARKETPPVRQEPMQ